MTTRFVIPTRNEEGTHTLAVIPNAVKELMNTKILIKTLKRKIMKKSSCLIATAMFGMLAYQSNAQVSLPFLEDFEPTSSSVTMWDLTNPEPIVVVDPSQSAYGIGTSALMYNFYAPLGYTNFNAKTPLINNPERSGLKVSFDFAACVRYTMPVFLQDEFAVDFIYLYASKDSGTSWALIDTFRIDTAGVLNTAGIYPNMLFIPDSSQWTTISDVKLPRGTNMLNFMGVRTNTWESNFAYMDNVKIDTCYTPQPTADSIQYNSTYNTVADLEASGTDLIWYSDAEGINIISDSTILSDSTYYFVTQTVNGCESVPFAILFADTTGNTTGISNINPLAGILTHPNPVKEHLTITGLQSNETISLYDMYGRKVREMKASSSTETMQVKGLSSGVYHLQVTDKAGNVNVKKIVVE